MYMDIRRKAVSLQRYSDLLTGFGVASQQEMKEGKEGDGRKGKRHGKGVGKRRGTGSETEKKRRGDRSE